MSPTSVTAGAEGVNADFFNPEIKVTLDGTKLSSTEMNDVLGWETESVLIRPSSMLLRILLPMDTQGTAQAPPAKWKPGAALKLEVATEVLFDGEITSVDFEGGNERPSEFVLLAYDKRHRLYRTETRSVFKDVTEADVANQLIQAAGLTAQTAAMPATVHKYFLHLGTAGDHLEQICDRYGLVMVMKAGTVKVLPPGEIKDDAGVVRPSVELLDWAFRRTSSGDLDKATVTAWDVKAKKEIIGEAKRATPAGQTVQPASGKSAFFETAMKHTSLAPAQAAAEKEAAGIIARNVDAGMQFDATCMLLPKCTAGALLEVKEIGAPYDGKYRLTSVRHSYDLADGGRTHVSCRGADDVTVTGLLSSAVGAPPAASTLDQKLHGVYPAIVTKVKSIVGEGAVAADGAAGEVKVKMPWLDPQLETSWMRVVTVGGGNNRGFFVLPEVNDEVLVAFEFGDTRRGYVLGGLYNGADVAPKPDDPLLKGEAVEQRIWMSRTGHQITLSDKDGDEYILIRDKTKKNWFRINSKDNSIEIQNEGDIKATTKGKVAVDAKGAVSVKTVDDVTIEGKNVTIKASVNLNLEATTNATLKGTVGAKVEGAKVDINSQGPATVKGNPIMLN